MAAARERDRCRERLTRLSESSLDAEPIQREAIAELRRVIGFDRSCWAFADPQTLIPLSGVAEHDYGPPVARLLELEYSGADLATMALARRTVPVGSLSADTRRDLARSPRWDEILRPVGIGDEAVVACRDTRGCWGWIKAYRDRATPPSARMTSSSWLRSAQAWARRSGTGSAARHPPATGRRAPPGADRRARPARRATMAPFSLLIHRNPTIYPGTRLLPGRNDSWAAGRGPTFASSSAGACADALAQRLHSWRRASCSRNSAATSASAPTADTASGSAGSASC